MLASRARQVIAVDPAAMDERALVPGVVTHLACKAELAVQRIQELVGAAGVDLLVSGGWLANCVLGWLVGWLADRLALLMAGCTVWRCAVVVDGWIAHQLLNWVQAGTRPGWVAERSCAAATPRHTTPQMSTAIRLTPWQ